MEDVCLVFPLKTFLGYNIPMNKFATFRHRSDKKIPEDPYAHERLLLVKYESYVHHIRSSSRQIELTLSQLHPMHDQMKKTVDDFFCTSPDPNQEKRTATIDEALLTLKNTFNECKGEFVSIDSRFAQILFSISELKKKLTDRDFAFWELKHYEEKVEDMQNKPKLARTAKLDRNLRKLADAKTRYDNINPTVLEELKMVNNERFKEVEETLRSYMLELNKYFTSISKKINDMGLKEVGAGSSPKAPFVPSSGNVAKTIKKIEATKKVESGFQDESPARITA
jgi:hypothetical protein